MGGYQSQRSGLVHIWCDSTGTGPAIPQALAEGGARSGIPCASRINVLGSQIDRDLALGGRHVPSWCVLMLGASRGEVVSCCSLTPGPSPATGLVLLLEAGCAGEGGNDFDSLPGVSTCGGYPGLG
jgi:hypothetical protein